MRVDHQQLMLPVPRPAGNRATPNTRKEGHVDKAINRLGDLMSHSGADRFAEPH
jgi:hypothetical protein